MLSVLANESDGIIQCVPSEVPGPDDLPEPGSLPRFLGPSAEVIGAVETSAEVIGAPGTLATVEEEDDDLKDDPKEPRADIGAIAGGTPTASAVHPWSEFAFQELMNTTKPFGGPKAWIWSTFQASPQKL